MDGPVRAEFPGAVLALRLGTWGTHLSCDKELGALFREQGWSHGGQRTDLPHEGRPSVTEVTDRGGGRHPGEVEGAWDSGANQRAQLPFLPPVPNPSCSPLEGR